jgi:hypothetical protein
MNMKFLNLLTHSRYTLLNWDLLQHIGINPHLVLLHLLSKYEYLVQTGKSDDNQWFYCLSEEIKETTTLTHPRQQKAIKILQDLDFIQVERKGIPAKLYFKINLEVIKQFFLQENNETRITKTENLDSLKQRNLNLENRESILLLTNTINNNTIKEELNYIVAENSATVNSKNEKYLPIAYKLGEIITSKKKIKINQSKLKSWAVSIRQLIERDDVQIERVNTALDWYEDNIGGDYVPVIESGKSLREKFIKLENAIERDKKPIAGKTRTGFKRGKLKYKRPEKL